MFYAKKIILIFLVFALFSCTSRSSTNKAGKAYSSHPKGTIRDTIFSGNGLPFFLSTALYENSTNQKNALREQLNRQLSWYNGIHVKGEFLYYNEGGSFFTKWYELTLTPQFEVNISSDQFDSILLDDGTMVIDNQGVSVKIFYRDESLSAPQFKMSTTFLSSLNRVRRPIDWLLINPTQKDDYLFTVGVAPRYSLRSTSYYESDKAALLELAKEKALTLRAKSDTKGGGLQFSSRIDGSLTKIDVTIYNFFVLYRWNDNENYYSVAVCRK